MSNGIVADGPDRHEQGIKEAEHRIRAAVRARYEAELVQADDQDRKALLLIIEREVREELMKEVAVWPSPHALY